MEGASVVLGSATPSMEAFYKAVTGEFRMLRLPARAKQRRTGAGDGGRH